MEKKYLFRCIYTAFIVCCSIFCSCSGTSDTSSVEQNLGSDSLNLSHDVEVCIAGMGSLSRIIEGQGSIKMRKNLQLSFENGGTLADLNILPNKRVIKGQVLAVLDTQLLHIEREKAVLDLSLAEFEWKNQLLQRDSSSLTQEALSNIRKSSGYDEAKIALKRIEYRINSFVLRANFTGIVSEILVQKGQKIQAGQIICSLYDPQSAYISLPILEEELANIQIGQKGKLILDSAPDKKLEAKVAFINPVVNQDHFFHVELKMMEFPRFTFPGMNATVQLHVSSQEPNIVLPQSSVVIRDKRAVVFTVKEGRAIWNYAELGIRQGEWVEVVSGVSKNDTVVLTNNLYLKQFTPLTIAKIHDLDVLSLQP